LAVKKERTRNYLQY